MSDPTRASAPSGMCPHCGEEVPLAGSLTIVHSSEAKRNWPIVCPGSRQNPRNAESDARPANPTGGSVADPDAASAPQPTRPFLHRLLLGASAALVIGGIWLAVLGVVYGLPVPLVLGVASIVVGSLIHREERRDPA